MSLEPTNTPGSRTGWKRDSARRKQLPTNWQKLRAKVLARDNHTCAFCGRKATHVDHIRRGQDHSSNNLRALCASCHMSRTGRDGGTTKRKPKPSTTRAPEPHPGLRKQRED